MIARARFFAAVAVVPLFTSCAQVLTVQPAGGLQHGVIFVFGDEFREHPAPFEVETVWLHQFEPGGGQVRIWMLEGKQSLSSIAYGAKYRGLKTVEGPRKLMRGQSYRVTVWTTKGAQAYYSADFRIDQSGAVIPLSP
jgi:hypothetical protein